MTQHPVDKPIKQSPGVVHREKDYHGHAGHGYYDGHGAASVVGGAKGNVSGAHEVPVPDPGAGLPDQERKDWR
jgi:hypothetical protein